LPFNLHPVKKYVLQGQPQSIVLSYDNFELNMDSMPGIIGLIGEKIPNHTLGLRPIEDTGIEKPK